MPPRKPCSYRDALACLLNLGAVRGGGGGEGNISRLPGCAADNINVGRKQKKRPMLCTGPFPKIVTGVHYEILFSYPSVESYSGDKLHGQLVAKQPLEPFSRSPFSSGFHAPGGCELGLRLDLQKTPVTNSKVPYQLYEPTALLQAYPWKTFQALSLLQESHTTSEPGNHSVSIDRFLRITFTCTPELFSKNLRRASLEDHLFYDFIVLRPQKSVNNS
jgi:hypothetical protein